MAETANIAQVAEKISDEIFTYFGWQTHPARDQNFPCVNDDHKTEGGKDKLTHPVDVVFHYTDPYLQRRVYLNTDLKSYGKSSIKPGSLRTALKSLALTVECACVSDQWHQRYVIDPDEQHEIRGLLFVHNHDNNYEHNFNETLGRINLSTLPIAKDNYLHVLGAQDISRLFSVANDISRLMQKKEMPDDYTFYYPDLVMWHRHGDVWGQAATVETLTAPYFIIKHKAADVKPSGYIIYYNRPGKSPLEFEYFLDSLSRFQLLDPDEKVRIRVCDPTADENIQNNFLVAKNRYARAWGFDPFRSNMIDAITLDHVPALSSNYSPAKLGWRQGAGK